jgi:hypothetical protein
MTDVAVIVPLRLECSYRERAWSFVQARFAVQYPSWEIVTAADDGEPFSKSSAVMRAARNVSADIVVIHDADVWCDHLSDAPQFAALTGWAIPHYEVLRLSEYATHQTYLHREDQQIDLVERHRGVVGGGIVVVDRQVLDDVPMDPRFRGWGGEDISWGHALRTLIGDPWRGRAPLYHYWHPPAPRLTRAVGSEESLALTLRYCDASRNPAQMRALIDEARQVVSSL